MDAREELPLVDGTLPSSAWQRLARPIAVLPLGAFEQHGPHLPLATDTLKAEYFARKLAQSLGAGLLPPLSICQSLEHSGFRGTVSLRPETFMNVIRDIVSELERQNFTRLVIVNGHGGNWSLGPTVREINRADRPIRVVLANYWEYDTSDEGREFAGDGIHAGAWETSIMLALFPDLVGDHKAVVPASFEGTEKQSDLNHLGLGVLRPNGVWGDPRRASAEAGRAIAASIEANLLTFVEERLEWFAKHSSYAGPGAVVVRPMTESDIPDGLGLCRAAGWNQRLEDWAFFYRSNPSGCFVAEHNGRTVGTVTTMVYGGEVSWIAMVLVDPAMRRRGIGTTLLVTAIDALSSCSCIKLDATPEGKLVYEKLGFAEEYRLNRMINDRVSPAPRMAPSPVRPMTKADLAKVSELDAEAFGIGRGHVIEELFNRAPEYAFVWDEDDKLAGYLVGRPGSAFEHIGPVVAREERVARGLMEAALGTLAGRRTGIDVPCGKPDWEAFLCSRGFVEQRPFARMYRGGNRRPGTISLMYGASGPELG